MLSRKQSRAPEARSAAWSRKHEDGFGTFLNHTEPPAARLEIQCECTA